MNNFFLYKIFYPIKPYIPRRLQIFVRTWVVYYKKMKYSHIWPIDTKSSTKPKKWEGWPEGKKFALILSHDVDTKKGFDKILELLDVEKKLGFKSSVNIVPELYAVSDDVIQKIKELGCQVCVHGLIHDGKLFASREIFEKRAERINHYLKKWGSIGFTAPSMLSNPEWMHLLNIQHSTCTFDTDPFEPQPDSSRTIFPFRVNNNHQTKEGYIELPYTLPQDHLLYVLMKESDISIWKRKLDWIAEKGGMALLNTHSDYMCMNGGPLSLEEYPMDYYIEFLEYVKTEYEGQYYHALPREIAEFWEKNESYNK